MGDKVFQISIPCDTDGFLTLECPFCNERFKLDASRVQQEDVERLFCPKCGLFDAPNHFWPTEVIEQAQILAANYAREMLNNFMGDLERSTRGNQIVAFKAGKKLEMADEKVLMETDDDFETVALPCCECQVKVKAIDKSLGVFCPYCGEK